MSRLPALPLLLLAALAAAAPPEDDLARLRERIRTVEQALAGDRGRLEALGRELEGLERELGEVGRELHHLEAEAARSRDRIAALRRTRDEAADTVGRHRALLRRQLRAAFAAGRAERVKLLLEQDDPGRVARMLAYHRRLARARARELERLQAEIARLAEAERRLAEEVRRLEGLQAAAAARRDALAASRAARAALAAEIERSVRARGQELAQLRADAERLEALVRSLREAPPLAEGERVPFARLRGRLRWPLSGRVLARYGSPRRGGGPQWRGLLIGARTGAPVRAVSHGRVVFADWLRGYGLLLIIDHGDGYMSLYAHNDALYKETGEWVEGGEVVAAVGASGGRREPALYFELRRDGEPLDPAGWLGRQVAGVK
ncbi:murein hydrolase activator EnvC family protein [Inmirania thermothiophila]|uniref:Septal ring factor EnvC (AmiA/AmiB activator) n=1 Tax=Inmirania thermothiophila TaxID=1750597 RepID=A0A3N1Y6S4_9GAMM|nr:peptidoglycan DD-metalloendopeptidase family protein [Inmirania thermothiophila]ROR34218.1 septal ring factor EnvC (AmiA/AmiB activator) [Inmirania thermothiophila]